MQNTKIFKSALCSGRGTGRLLTASHDIWICAGVPASVASYSRPNYQLRFPLCRPLRIDFPGPTACLPASSLPYGSVQYDADNTAAGES